MYGANGSRSLTFLMATLIRGHKMGCCAVLSGLEQTAFAGVFGDNDCGDSKGSGEQSVRVVSE